tara:strand:- start:78 stop:425 length:348 start_codon:yes stop_codon:yes gene_type:complete
MVTSLYSIPFKVTKDNFNLEIDKTAHAMVSAGLYYQGLVLQDTSKNEYDAIWFAFLVGFGWETYQGFRHRKHGGFSLHDLQYNVAGILSAHLQKKIWFYFKKIKSNRKLTDFSNK